jgi:hypothetical protein
MKLASLLDLIAANIEGGVKPKGKAVPGPNLNQCEYYRSANKQYGIVNDAPNC